MHFVQRKATTSKSKQSVEEFDLIRRAYLEDFVATVEIEEIPPQLIFNWDQTGIKLVPSTSWTMAERGSKRVELIGLSDKRQITAVFCGIQLSFVEICWENFCQCSLFTKGKPTVVTLPLISQLGGT